MAFEPDGKYAWDLWFAHDGKMQHIFYLQAPKEESDNNPDNRHNLSSVGHGIIQNNKIVCQSSSSVFEASTADNTWDNLSIWTGSIIKDPHSKQYLMFYTARSKEDKPVELPHETIRKQQIGLATSSDLNAWARHPKSIETPIIPNPGNSNHLDAVTFRDPFVFQLGSQFYCLITGKLEPNEKFDIASYDQGGCIVVLTSDDLYDWSQSEPQIMVASRHYTQMEVPQLFSKTEGDIKYYYLIFCAQVKDVTEFRRNIVSEQECQSGTYILKSEPMEKDSKELPYFSNKSQAKILTPGLYAGRVLDPENENPTIYGFKIDPRGGDYLGGIDCMKLKDTLI